jgi:hypothetical protein
VLIDTIALVHDADPKNPAPRSFTTDNATLEEGWYLITFFDASGNDALPVEPIHNLPENSLPYTPTVEDVAHLIMSRTKDNLGNEVGTFNANTRPTFQQASEIIQQAVSDVTTIIDDDIPEASFDDAEQAIALRAAMLIERSYFAEQVNSNRSPYPLLRADYEVLMGNGETQGTLQRAVERESQELITGEVGGTNRPSYSFPDPDLRYGLGRQL